ncbi:MAG TPA: glycerophosphodiester phosphodiesterase [Gaiellaceae bacterium]|nr:glycerophosphodiester phosphodiesterase [Gaiellaceae bacterium]
MNLRRDGRRPLVIGHRGAAALAPENTLASFAAAVDAGCDVVEFDVGAGLVVAHSASELPEEPIALDDALDFLRGRGVGAHVDVKVLGIEPQIVHALRRHGLADRAFVSSAIPRSVRRAAALAPELPRALGYPRDRLGAAGLGWPRGVAAAGARALRAAMPLRVPLLLRATGATALSLHRTIVSAPAVTAAHVRGAAVVAWTANDPETVVRLVEQGVDAIVSDDPRVVFETLATLGNRQ